VPSHDVSTRVDHVVKQHREKVRRVRSVAFAWFDLAFMRVDRKDHEIGELLCAPHFFKDLEMVDFVHRPRSSRLLAEPVRLSKHSYLGWQSGLIARSAATATTTTAVASDRNSGRLSDSAHLLKRRHLLRVDYLHARRSENADARARWNVRVLVEWNRSHRERRCGRHHADAPLR
jgi:hypothetical protein